MNDSNMKPSVHILRTGRLEVHVSTLGATLTRLLVPGGDGQWRDVLLGMERAEDYASPGYVASGAYLGAAIGRYANRIAGGRFVLEGREYRLAVNNGGNHLHGGACGFDRRLWTVGECRPGRLVLRYLSPDGEEGYPGNLAVEITFSVCGGQLCIGYRATVDKPCYVNLTHHPYFNLTPESADIRSHRLTLHTGTRLRSVGLIPDGTFLANGGVYDFSRPVPLSGIINACGGLDDCFVFAPVRGMRRMATLEAGGLRLCLFSDYPGLQVYTGRYLDVPGARAARHYTAYAGVALEPQYFPDSPNHPAFPSPLLRPGEEYRHSVLYEFGQDEKGGVF